MTEQEKATLPKLGAAIEEIVKYVEEGGDIEHALAYYERTYGQERRRQSVSALQLPLQ